MTKVSSPSYVEIATRLRNKVGKEIQKNTNLYMVGVGGGLMDNVEMLALSFEHRGTLNNEEARTLAFLAADTLITKVNSCKELKPYLANDPFDYSNVQIRIFIKNPDGSDTKTGQLSGISILRNSVNYYDFTLGFDNCIIKEESLLVDQKSSPETTEPPDTANSESPDSSDPAS